MTHRLQSALVIASAALISNASAHPGPPGHTHLDEWPFEPFAIAVTAILVIAVKIMRKKDETNR
ncbi:MAG: hypothetical protein QNL33_20655 [Akkermansiaceae bacterium]